MNEPDLVASVQQRGFAIVRDVLSPEMLLEFRDLCSKKSDHTLARRKGQTTYGVRQLLATTPRLAELVAMPPFITIAKAVLGESAQTVKGIFFDKTPEANWPVPWHQDVTVTLQPFQLDSQADFRGFEFRPVKEGVVHAIPPLELSEQMLAMRIHLDDAMADHGALRVIPGSHSAGRLDSNQTASWLKSVPEVVCSVRKGDVMLMRPLLLHASSACNSPEHRRVIHIEYSSVELPCGLAWAG